MASFGPPLVSTLGTVLLVKLLTVSTMVDSRTNYSKDISNLIRESYGGKLKVYKTDIPRSVRAEEISAEGASIFKHDPKGKVADAYRVLTKEVLKNAEKRRKHQLEGVR